MTKDFKITLKKARRALNRMKYLKSPSCLDVETIGFYIEGRLSEGEKKRVEGHINSCLYCLNQLLEMKELIYLHKHRTPINTYLIDRLKNLHQKKEREATKSIKEMASKFLEKAYSVITLPFRRWQYTAVAVITAVLTISIFLGLWREENCIDVIPKINPECFVRVQALNREGKILNDTTGVIIDFRGIAATYLTSMIGADMVRITLKDGRAYQVKKLWKGEEEDIALMKIEQGSFSALPIADLRGIYIGQKVLILADPFKIKNKMGSAVISDLKEHYVRGIKGGIKYIHLASFTSHYSRGALVDQDGRLIGLVVSSEKNMNLAVPLDRFATLIQDQKPVSISELKGINLSPDALNYYFKGILARDAGRNDEAMKFFKKATELNPDLEGPHLELGLLYYKKRLFDLEIKEYQNVLRINPKNTDALFYLAQAYESKGLYGAAIKKYEEIIRLDPEDAETYYHLGLAYLTQGERKKAKEIYPKLKVFDPGFAEKLKRLTSFNE